MRFIAREHKRKLFSDAVLTLGRQGVFATLDQAREILLSEQLTPSSLPHNENTCTNIPSWKGTWNERFISDTVFFKLLGLKDITALDCSNYEKADFVFDLNLPVPTELKNRFSLIIDGGTLEHVFDVKQALININLMLKPGGRIIHMVPANNYVNHGFYQFSPTLFFDYYQANNFTDLKGFIADENRYLDSWDIYQVAAQRHAVNQMISTTRLLLVFIAEKTEQSTAEKVPSQGRYMNEYVQPDTASFPKDTPHKVQFRKLIPNQLEIFLRRYVLAYDPMNRLPHWLKILMLSFVPGLDKNKNFWKQQNKPWGVELWDRL